VVDILTTAGILLSNIGAREGNGCPDTVAGNPAKEFTENKEN
jgi:hypothetical protein